ncbi:helix-turn-helix domain-containing protein [Streptomyces sp. 6N223]|uniref:helix-turn-helix domain-containing protein n=1 Tax=Streptomyces sp. 6N223 TaxID=3457412 RepID=UPI003FD110AD
MILLRRLLGDVLRRQRQRQGRTLREVSSSARVSLGYLSEVERGQKEASSELLSAICDALELRMSELLREVSDELALAELAQSASDTVPSLGVPPGRGLERPMERSPMLNPVRVTSVTHRPDDHVTIKAPSEAVDVVAA